MYVTIDDATYWYEVYGDRDKETLVVLHGFTSSTKTWTSFISQWKSDYQLVLIDLPGHGKTMTPPRTMEACCHDLHELLTLLKIPSYHLLGYSMGGRTALSYAMLFPSKVKSIILESASPGLITEEERISRIKQDEQLAGRIEKEGIKAFVSFWENIPLFSTQKLLPTSVQKQIRMERLSQSEEGLAQSLRFMGTGRQPSWWEQLHTWTKPVLLLVGEQDEKFIQMNKKMKKHFPNACLTEIKYAGHTIHVEQAEKFGKIVLDHLHSIQ